ncbi:hypothetical protein MOO44_04605 [Nicoliella spurrieriana]|uniref:Uncharacterized protein n=2 Tax=Nicoliella spurrieriana TaxID=2925830 RepID=A0A976RTN4_9LACO|nr:hypothetical protein MOO44_04605 [Nicoliella spurrieriana]
MDNITVDFMENELLNVALIIKVVVKRPLGNASLGNDVIISNVVCILGIEQN